LAIHDLSTAGHMPMSNEDGRIWITYNGEIYNFLDVRRELLAKGHTFRSKTDTEVIIHLYEEEGLGMLSRLNGIFAFALWDAKEQRLFLARDGVGVKPLYYAETSSGFLFASELKALLLCPEVSRELDLLTIHHHLAYLWAPAPRTMLKGVRKLPPGRAMLVKEGRVRQEWAHYDLPYDNQRLPGDEEEIIEELRARLEEAVYRQMVSDVPIGAMLSGGLDSSTVVAMMKRARPDYRPRCYSIGFENDMKDMEGSAPDLPYARRVADHLNVDLCPIVVGADMIDHLERLLYHLDEPQADPAPINALLIAEQARRDGIKVLLSGTGGDDLLSGYRRHWALLMERFWGWLPLVLRQGLAGWATHGGGTGVWIRRLRRALAYADLPPEDRMLSYFYWTGEQVRRSLYSPDLSLALNGIDTAEPLRSTLRNIPQEGDRLNRILYLEGKHFLADHNLNYLDKAAMTAGVEVRVPLLDLELLPFIVRIPPGFKRRGSQGKYILRKAMEPYLPRDVIYRQKTGFGAPLRRWLRHELREMVEEMLSEKALKERGLFRPQAVHALMVQDRQGKVDAAYTIFALLCIEIWCRIFVDRPVEAISRAN
jgi:asparagine synthase (glutamine-hydrolysing)